MTTIREITADDWAAFRDVRLASLSDAPTAFAVTLDEASSRSDAEWEAMVRDRCTSGTSATWIAETSHGSAVGVVAAFESTQTDGDVELVSMWVDPAARGAGIAAGLIDTVMVWARNAGAATVSLWVTRGNDPASRLYESAGFAVTGDHQPLPSDPCKDEIRMTRPV